MKFIVTKDVLDVTEVKLHWETKEKIISACVWTGSLITLGTLTAYFVKRSIESEEQ